MNETTIGARAIPDGTLTFPFEGMPAPGEAMEMAPGVHWLRMPLPFALNHINLWLIEEDGGFAIVDTGINAPEVKALWQTVIAKVMAGRPVTRVIVTHMHPDHIGLAGWLCAEHNVRLWITRTEWLMHKMLFHESLEVSRIQAECHAAFHHDHVDIDAIRGKAFAPQQFQPFPASATDIQDRLVRLTAARQDESLNIGCQAFDDVLAAAAEYVLERRVKRVVPPRLNCLGLSRRLTRGRDRETCQSALLKHHFALHHGQLLSHA